MVLEEDVLHKYSPIRQLIFMKAADGVTFDLILSDLESFMRTDPIASDVELPRDVNYSRFPCVDGDVAEDDSSFFRNALGFYDLSHVDHEFKGGVGDNFIVLYKSDLFDAAHTNSGLSGRVLSIFQLMTSREPGARKNSGIIMNYTIGGPVADRGSPLVKDLIDLAPRKDYCVACNMHSDGQVVTFFRESVFATAFEEMLKKNNHAYSGIFKVEQETFSED